MGVGVSMGAILYKDTQGDSTHEQLDLLARNSLIC